MLPAVALAVVVLTLAGCLLTGEVVDSGGLYFFGSFSVDNYHGIFAVPETRQQHFRGIRFAASSYPVQVYRVVIVYRGGEEKSYAVNWWFTDRVRYHNLRVPGDRAVREVRIYQRQPGPITDKHGRRKWKEKGRGDDERDRAGSVIFKIYGLP